MASPYLEQALAKIEFFEGCIPWMYLDTRGNVTVGVGLMLPSAAAAQKLDFRCNEHTSTPAEIAADFARVEAMPMGRPALHYRSNSSPELPRPEIDHLLRTVVVGSESQLKIALPAYDTFPDNIKLALLDMAYNLGPHGLLNGFPHLIAAAKEQNWAEAARVCFRHGPGAARNLWTQQMFQSSVVPSLRASSTSPLKSLGYGIVGASASAIDWFRRVP